ncbi:hypothetical protein TNCV_621051 [Trichonephila clavipes]|nr:hypothetical protein TNCV_621051 [Trichonephila clavipes]
MCSLRPPLALTACVLCTRCTPAMMGPVHDLASFSKVGLIPSGTLFSPEHDEAHFWLNGYVDKQNCRIWSEANPQVYVETPLHPEKLTVWCTLWAGGILLQKR